MKLYYRLGVAADRELLQRYAHLLDGFVINAHIGAWSGGWLPVFLQQLEKPYYIDPYTSIYSHNIEGTLNPSGEPKASFLKLADRLPRHIRTALDEVSPIQPTSLLDEGVAADTVDNILTLQREIFQTRDPDQQSILDYLDFLDGDQKDDELQPEFLVAPYFRFDALDDPWLEVNRRMIMYSLEKRRPDERLMAVICTTEAMVVSSEAREHITEVVGGAEAVDLWVDGFDETRASATLLSSLSDIVESLAKDGKEVHLSYGGYLSIILQKLGLAGSCSGLGYGMSKSVEAKTTGGGFPKRWYHPELHSYMDETAFRSYFSAHPSELDCTCPACEAARAQALLTTSDGTPEFIDIFMSSMDKDGLNLHFLQCRNREVHETASRSFEEIISQLRDIQGRAERNKFRDYNISFDFLDRWISFLSGHG